MSEMDHIIKEIYRRMWDEEFSLFYRRQRRIATLPRTIKNRERKLPVHYQTYGKPRAEDLSPRHDS